MIDVSGQVLPVLSFNEFLRGAARPAICPSQTLLITRSGERKLALLAQEVVGVISVAATQLVEPETIAPTVKGITAVLRQPEGLVLLPDLECIFSDGPHRPSESPFLAAA